MAAHPRGSLATVAWAWQATLTCPHRKSKASQMLGSSKSGLLILKAQAQKKQARKLPKEQGSYWERTDDGRWTMVDAGAGDCDNAQPQPWKLNKSLAFPTLDLLKLYLARAGYIAPASNKLCNLGCVSPGGEPWDCKVWCGWVAVKGVPGWLRECVP